MKFHLVLMSGKNPGKTAAFEQQCVILGRDPSCDVRFSPETWPDVPAQFAQIVERELGDTTVFGLQYLVDETSPDFGTIAINNDLLTRRGTSLNNDDVIRFGVDGPVVRFRTGLPVLGEQPPPAAPKVTEFDAKLVMLSGNSNGREFNLSNETMQRIGGHPSMEVSLDPNDPLISGCHAVIAFKDGQWQLTNNSRHSTYVNGHEISDKNSTVLNNGDLISLGKQGPQAKFLCSDNPLHSLTEKRSSMRKTPERSAPGISPVGKRKLKLRPAPAIIAGCTVLFVLVGGMWIMTKSSSQPSKSGGTLVASATPAPQSAETPKPLPPTPLATPETVSQLPAQTEAPAPVVTPTPTATPTPTPKPTATPPPAPTATPTPTPAPPPQLVDAGMKVNMQFPDSSWSFRKVSNSELPAAVHNVTFYDVTAPTGNVIRFTWNSNDQTVAQLIDKAEADRKAQGATNIAKNTNSIYYKDPSGRHCYIAYVPCKDGSKFILRAAKMGSPLNRQEQKEIEQLFSALAEQR